VLTTRHERALGLVYGAALGGWSYLVAWGILLEFGLSNAQETGAVIGAVAGLAVMWDVERMGRNVSRGEEQPAARLPGSTHVRAGWPRVEARRRRASRP
jgi:hypothetical protein